MHHTVLSLNALGMQHKERYYEDQLDSRGVNVAFFQETKSGGGCCQSARFLRLSTPADTHWGVAVWISRHRGLGTLEERPCLVEEADISVLKQTERLLILLVTKGDYKFILILQVCRGRAVPADSQPDACRVLAGPPHPIWFRSQRADPRLA